MSVVPLVHAVPLVPRAFLVSVVPLVPVVCLVHTASFSVPLVSLVSSGVSSACGAYKVP